MGWEGGGMRIRSIIKSHSCQRIEAYLSRHFIFHVLEELTAILNFGAVSLATFSLH